MCIRDRGGETQQAQDYLAALQEQQTERALMVNTHNSVIDAVLNQKGYAAQKPVSYTHLDVYKRQGWKGNRIANNETESI